MSNGDCRDPGPYGSHCTEWAGHKWSCYDASKDQSFNNRTFEDTDTEHGECHYEWCTLRTEQTMNEATEAPMYEKIEDAPVAQMNFQALRFVNPSGAEKFRPIIDVHGQRFIGVWKHAPSSFQGRGKHIEWVRERYYHDTLAQGGGAEQMLLDDGELKTIISSEYTRMKATQDAVFTPVLTEGGVQDVVALPTPEVVPVDGPTPRED